MPKTTTTPAAPSFPEWQHRVDIIVSDSADGPFRVTAGLHYMSGNSAPYFSVTAESVRLRKRTDGKPGVEWRTYDGPGAWGGAAHNIILRELPQLAPVVALHLADHHGEPMHAIENGAYWLLGYAGGLGASYHGGNTKRQHWLPDGTFNGYRESTPDECLATFARHFLLDVDEARAVADELLAAVALDAAQRDHMVRPGVIDSLACQRGALKIALVKWYETRKPALADLARQAIALLDSLATDSMRRKVTQQDATDLRCECGEATGERCQWTGPRAETVLVEWMPPHLRASHTAAGNTGSYPANGALRLRVHRACAELLTHEPTEDGEIGEPSPWARIVEGVVPPVV